MYKRRRTVRNGFKKPRKQTMKKSSVYAVSQVGKTKSAYRNMWWITVLGIGLCGCSYEVVQFLELFFKYPILLDVQVKSAQSLDFPAVTICNLNRMQHYFESCLKKNTPFEDCEPAFSAAKFGSPVISERKKIGSCSSYLTGYMDDKRRANMDFLMRYTKLDANQRKLSGHQLDQLVQFCSFDNKPCVPEDFIHFQSLQYGNCYTFNRYNATRNFVLKTFSVGNRNGLELILDMSPGDYQRFTSSLGARISIHDPYEDPNPEDEGFNISPGFETSLGLSQKFVERLPAPYRDRCFNYRTDETVRGKNRNECVRSCIQDESFIRCSCVDPTLPNSKNAKHCNISDKQDACCLDNVLEIMSNQGIPCECPLPCSSTTYQVQISKALWPSKHDTQFAFSYGEYNKYALKYNREKLARINIYFSTLEQVVQQQIPQFHNSELLSNLGSQFSLWLGLSLCALFELIEMLIFL